MRVAINVEFSEQELERFVERWTNKLIVDALSQVARGVSPSVIGAVQNAVMQAVIGQTAPSRGKASTPAEAPPVCDDCEQELRTHCVPIEAPNVAPGWVCHQCRTYNGLQRMQCKSCGHKRCGPAFTLPPEAIPCCEPIISPDTLKAVAWVCHECGVKNPMTAAKCIGCAHERCRPGPDPVAAPVPPPAPKD
jgi:ribosomal protein L40E